MDRDDFAKLVGAESGSADCLPVACLLRNGYACAGHYHAALNEDLASTCVLLNAHLIALEGDKASGRPNISDFNEFLEEIVVNFCRTDGDGQPLPKSDIYGKSIPLTAIPYDQIAVVYPVAHIGALMRRAEKPGSKLPRFLDLGKSEIVNLLRTKLW
jgi:hypothetical protein